MGYRIWFVDKVEGTKILTESEAPTIIYTIRCVLYAKVTSIISIWICTLVKLDTGYWIWYPPL